MVRKQIVALVLGLGCFMLFGQKAHAASLTVSNTCTLANAITSVNGASDNGGCTASGAYGTNDTINLPSGTITLSADLPNITKSVIFQGAGMSSTTVDGDSLYRPFSTNDPTVDLTVNDMKITKYMRSAIYSNAKNVTLARLDIDGAGTIPDSIQNYVGGVFIFNDQNLSVNYSATDIYVHDITTNSPAGTFGFGIGAANGKAVVANLEKITIANLHATTNSGYGQVFGFTGSIGAFSSQPTTGTITTQISNVTIDNLIGDNGGALAFGTVVFASGGSANSTMNVKNATLTRITGKPIQVGPNNTIPSTAFYAVSAAIGQNDQSVSTINIQNTLVAQSVSNNVPSSCSTTNMNFLFNGAGTATPSINSLGHNLSDDNTCTSFTQSGDVLGISNLLSTLGPLQLNGGLTPTRALLPGSPAIGAGTSVLGISTDQRGVARPTNNPDVGAFQTVLASSTSVVNNSEQSLAKTGATVVSSIALAALLIGSLVYVFVDYRRHRKPLVEADPNTRYSLAHHVKLVTLPLIRYRLSVSLHQKGGKGIVRKF